MQREASFDPYSPFGTDVRRRAAALRLGMWVFIAALAMFFFASLLAYIAIRLYGKTAPAIGAIHMPIGLFVSTLILLTSGWTVHQALMSIKRERQQAFKGYIIATAVLGLCFLGVQYFSLGELLHNHTAARTKNIHLYMLMVVLIVTHGLHLIGGFVPLSIVTYKALSGGYDHEYHAGVDHFVLYWHFLDVVWLIMFGTFLVLR